MYHNEKVLPISSNVTLYDLCWAAAFRLTIMLLTGEFIILYSSWLARARYLGINVTWTDVDAILACKLPTKSGIYV